MRKLSEKYGYHGVRFQMGAPSSVNFTGWRQAGSFMCVGYGPSGDTALRKAIKHLAKIGLDAEWLYGTISTECLHKCRATRRRRVYCIVWFDKTENGVADETYLEDE